MRKLLVLIVALAFTQPSHSAYNFDGVNDLVAIGTSSNILANGSAFSAYAAFRARSTGEGAAGRIFDSMTDGFVGQIQLRVATTEALNITCNGSTNLIRTSNTSAYQNNVWNYVVFTGDGSTTAANYHIYLNGQEVTYATTTNGASLISNSGATRKIGNTVSGLNTFDGEISEAAVWNVQLNEKEAIALTSAKVRMMPLQIRPASLQGYWPLDDFGQGVTASGTGASRDRSSNGRHGTPTSGPTGRPDPIAYP